MELFGWELSETAVNLLYALALIVIGLITGGLVGYLLKKILDKFEFKKRVSESFLKLITLVIQISIYITFFVLALYQLEVPNVTEVVSKILIVVPAFTGAVILLGFGLAIAIYLREVIEDSEMSGWRISSQLLFYFIIYTIGVYALRIALASISEFVRNWIIIVITAVCSTALAYYIVRRELKIPSHNGSH